MEPYRKGNQMAFTTGEILEEHLRYMGDADHEASLTDTQKKQQLQSNRLSALKAWCYSTDKSRWAGDDGRQINHDDYDRPGRWTAEIVTAEQARFDELDAAYEKAKIFHGVS